MLTFWLLFFLVTVKATSGANKSDCSSYFGARHELGKYLRQKAIADTDIPPTDDEQSGIVPTGALFDIVSIQEVNEHENTISISASIVFYWNASTLGYSWNPSDFCHIEDTKYPKASARMWTPSVAVTNMVNIPDYRDANNEAPAAVRYNGQVIFPIYSVFELSCSLSLEMFPFDYQVCGLNISVLNTKRGNAFFSNEFIYPACTNYYHPNPRWSLLATRVVPFIEGTMFQFVIKRHFLFSMLSVVIPTVLLAVAGVAMFITPAHSSEKMTVCFAVLLAFFFVFSSIMNSFPPYNMSFPFLGFFLLGLLAVTVLSAVASALVNRVAEFLRSSGRPLRATARANGIALGTYIVLIVGLSLFVIWALVTASERWGPREDFAMLNGSVIRMPGYGFVFFSLSEKFCATCKLNATTLEPIAGSIC